MTFASSAPLMNIMMSSKESMSVMTLPAAGHYIMKGESVTASRSLKNSVIAKRTKNTLQNSIRNTMTSFSM